MSPVDINALLKFAEEFGQTALDLGNIQTTVADKVIVCPKCNLIFYRWDEKLLVGCPRCSTVILIKKLKS